MTPAAALKIGQAPDAGTGPSRLRADVTGAASRYVLERREFAFAFERDGKWHVSAGNGFGFLSTSAETEDDAWAAAARSLGRKIEELLT